MDKFKIKAINEKLSKLENYTEASIEEVKDIIIDQYAIKRLYKIKYKESNLYYNDVLFEKLQKQKVEEVISKIKHKITYFEYLKESPVSRDHLKFTTDSLSDKYEKLLREQGIDLGVEEIQNLIYLKIKELIRNSQYENDFKKVYEYILNEGFKSIYNESVKNKKNN